MSANVIHQSVTATEPRGVVPPALLLGSMVAAAGTVVVVWALATGGIDWWGPVTGGAAITLLIALVSALILGPGSPRPMTSLMTRWLGATVLRLLVTPLAALVLYSATFPNDRSFWLSVGVTYIAVLFTEAGLLAWILNGQLDRHDASTAEPASTSNRDA